MKIINIAVLLLFAVILYAHEGHKEKVKFDTVTVVNGDTIAVNGKAVESLKEKPSEIEEVEPFVLKPTEEIFEHLHNKIVHFPIAMGLLAFFFTLLNFKWKNFDKSIIISVAIGLIFSILAFFTGRNQAVPFERTGKEWLVALHQNIGISVLVTYFVWFVFLLVKRFSKYSWIIGLIVFVLILITGFLGGVIAH